MKYFRNAINAGPCLFVLLSAPFFLAVSFYNRIPSALAGCGVISSNIGEVFVNTPNSNDCLPCVESNNADRVQTKSGNNWLCGFTGTVDVKIPNTLGAGVASLVFWL
jgi:hypothetical protein